MSQIIKTCKIVFNKEDFISITNLGYSDLWGKYRLKLSLKSGKKYLYFETEDEAKTIFQEILEQL
jgi:hypothetical protein